jgi:serine/threonine protein phosphatase PrpC
MSNSPAEEEKSPPRMAFEIERDFAGRQFVGGREKQEDFYAFSDVSENKEIALSKLLVVLGDGLGAHLGGNLASYHVVTQFAKSYKTSTLPAAWRLRVALEQANESLYFLSSRIALDQPPMGTTLVGLVISNNSAHWISVGDSPLFLFRDGKLERLNADHSLAPMLDERVLKGELTAEDAAVHPDRHVLQSACMGQPLTMVDVRMEPFELKSGDIVISASDGIFTLEHEQLQEMLVFGKNSSAGKIVEAIILAIRCVDQYKQDNVTVAVVKIP